MNIRTKIILTVVLLLAAMLLCTGALADERFTIDSNGTITGYRGYDTDLVIPNTIDGITVTSIGFSAFRNCDNLTSISIPNGVTFISEDAFYSCNSLSFINIPSTVTYIGPYAFYGCSSLADVSIPGSVHSINDYAFSYCSSLTNVSIADGVTSIGDHAFYDCSNLADVSIPGSVTYIGDWAFFCCNDLTNVSIPDGVTSIGDWAFHKCSNLASVSIPNSVTYIGAAAFEDCSNLANVSIPNSVTYIGVSAFDGCILSRISAYGCCGTNSAYVLYNDGTLSITGDGEIEDRLSPIDYIESVVIGDGITHIRDDVFSSGTFKSVTIPDSVAYIGNYAFQNCDNLISVTIPDDVISIGVKAFDDCECLTLYCRAGTSGATEIGRMNDYGFVDSDCPDYMLQQTDYTDEGLRISIKKYIGSSSEIVLPSNIKSIPVTSISKNAFRDCNIITSVTLPNSITSIGNDSFAQSNLASITIPDSVVSIGYSAFSYCNNLTSVTIEGRPDDITFIDEYAFSTCSNLTSFTVLNGVVSIGRSAFEDCSNLTSFTIPNGVSSIGQWAFEGCNNITIYCHAGTSGATTLDRRFVDPNCPDFLIFQNGYTEDDFTIEIAKYIGSAAEVVIPSTIKSVPVTSIWHYAFENCSNVTTITIPDSILYISDYAFEGCNNLRHIVIPNKATPYYTLHNIPNAFTIYCYKDSGVDYWAAANGYITAYLDAELPLLTLALPAQLKTIAAEAFMNVNATKVLIPDGCTSIGTRAFAGSQGLVIIVMPDSVKSIADDAFEGCGNVAFLCESWNTAAAFAEKHNIPCTIQ